MQNYALCLVNTSCHPSFLPLPSSTKTHYVVTSPWKHFLVKEYVTVLMIRPVQPTDAAALVAVYNPFITDTTITFEAEPIDAAEMCRRIEEISREYPYYVYEENGEVLGYAYIHRWKPRIAYRKTAEVTIYLSPKAQGRGVGRQLLTRLIADARRLQLHALIACITQGNEHSIAFHKAMGFRQVSQFEKVGYKFGRLLDVVDLELLLV